MLLLTLTAIGTVSFRLIAGASWIDSTYMAVITLTTVGFREVVPLNDTGKIFVIIYLVFGLGTFTYSAFQLGQWIVSAEMRSLWEKRRMQKSIEQLSNHFIICGIGRMGKTICRYLHERNQSFVVIDIDDERLVSSTRALASSNEHRLSSATTGVIPAAVTAVIASRSSPGTGCSTPASSNERRASS